MMWFVIYFLQLFSFFSFSSSTKCETESSLSSSSFSSSSSSPSSTPRHLYIFCVQSGDGAKFHRYMDPWRWSLYNLNHTQHVTIEILQVNWESKSKIKFLIKPKAYLERIQHVIENIQNNSTDSDIEKERIINNSYVILVDSDIFWSNPTINEIWSRYDCIRHNKEIIVSTELNCWLGRYCTKEDIQFLYSNTLSGYSSFVNSGAIMGSLTGVEKMLVNITTDYHLYFIQAYNGYKFDDQYAVAIYILQHPLEGTLDNYQELFGTFQIYNPTPNGTQGYVCKMPSSSSGTVIVTEKEQNQTEISYFCEDITQYFIRYQGIHFDSQSCSITRTHSPSFTNQLSSSVSSIWSSLSSSPLLWHGNGGGKRLYLKYRSIIQKCFMAKYGVQIEKYSCHSDGCREQEGGIEIG